MSPQALAADPAAAAVAAAAGLRVQIVEDDAMDVALPLLVAGPPGPSAPALLRRPGGLLLLVPAGLSLDAADALIGAWVERGVEAVHLEGEDPPAALAALLAAAPAAAAARLYAEAAHAEQARLELAVRLAGLGAFDLDVPTGRMRFAPGARAAVGLSTGPDTLQIQDWMAQVHPHDRARVWETTWRHLRGEEAHHHVEYRWMDPAGGALHLRVAGLVSHRDAEGRALRLCGTAHNLTALREAEAELAREELRLEAISWATGEFLVELDAEGVLRFVSPSAEAVLGRPPAALVGQPLTALLHPSAPLQPEALRRALSGHLRGQLVPLRRPDGSRVWLEVDGRPLPGPAGGFLGLARDVSALQGARDQLLAAVAEAEAAAQARAAFLSALSRDIRTPMNDVLGLTELLVDGAGASMPEPRVRAHLQTMRRTGEGLLRVLDDVIDLSKIEQGALDVAQAPFSPEQVCAEVLSVLSQRAWAREVELLFDAPVDPDGLPAAVRGDGPRLRQVLLNLVGNAIKFTEQGVVRVGVRYLRAEGRLVVEVSDTGIGISPEQLGKLFSPFVQGDASVQRRFGGTGLGLSISQRIVALQGGEIVVESRPGHGSRFTVRLPAPLETEATPGARFSGKRALLVAAHPELRAGLAAQLEAWGLAVVAAPSVSHAVAQLGQGGAAFDLAVLDLRLPPPDGTVLLRILRAAPRTAKLPVIALAGVADGSRVDAARALGIDELIIKPVRPIELRRCVGWALGGDRAPVEPAAPAPAPAPAARVRVLLVEDNPINQEVATLQLARAGAEVVVAEDGLVALEVLEQQRFDLVLMDCQMPRMDGYAATRALRQRPWGAALPVVALTANAMQGDRERCLHAGMDDYLSKPVRQHELEAMISRWVKVAR